MISTPFVLPQHHAIHTEWACAWASATSRFGRQFGDFALANIEFEPSGEFGPCTISDSATRKVRVRISRFAFARWGQGDPYTVRYELMHEAVHVLAPSGEQAATSTWLEEGVAAWHSWTLNPNFAPGSAELPNYIRAGQLVQTHLGLIESTVKRLRERQPVLDLVTADDLLAVMPGLRTEVAHELAQLFPGSRRRSVRAG